MHPARIAELLHPFLHDANNQRRATNDALYKDISTYIDILQHWNARINLTAIRHPEEIVTRHFGESFFLARHLFKTGSPDSPRVLDIGSGAGFPALPLKIWAPHIHLTLIESNHKKATFLREVARALTLTNINVITERAETLAARPDFPRADVVTLRAVERFEVILPQAVTLLAPQATLALLIGAAQIPHLTTLTTLKWHPPIPVPQSHERVLSIGIL